jgi:hypothetical protein
MNQAQQRVAQQAASARGMSRGGANAAAIRGASDLYANTNEQAGIMRAQEQIAAQQLASQHTRDMRQQDLLARGYSIEEAKAIMDAEIRVQDINAQTARANAANAQGPSMLLAAAAGGALASDERAKEIMYSDFTGKETLPMSVPGVPMAGAGPVAEPAVRPAGGFQPMLTVTPTKELDDSAEKQQQSIGERAMAGASAAGGGSNLAQNAETGFSIGKALGGLLSDFSSKEYGYPRPKMGKARAGSGSTFDMSPERFDRMGRFEVKEAQDRYQKSRKLREAENLLRYRRDSAKQYDSERERLFGDRPMSSDFRSKEPTMADLDQVGREAMLPFEEMDAQDSREALAPVDPVVYRYKPEDSARMAGEQADMADLRARYSGLGGAAPEEEHAIAQSTFEDKRKPRLGIIAQDLQKSPDFRQSVISTPAGLAVQRDRALSTALGSLAGLDKRLRELEGIGDEQSGKIRGESTKKARERRLLESRY